MGCPGQLLKRKGTLPQEAIEAQPACRNLSIMVQKGLRLSGWGRYPGLFPSQGSSPTQDAEVSGAQVEL